MVEAFKHGLDLYNQLYTSEQLDGRTIAITQSSGTGKSKLMYDLADHVS
jgi:ABC-type lipoprotein export system ATPase subunit